MEALAPPLPLLLLIMGALILLLKMEPAANNRKIGADVTRIGLSLEITAEKLADAAPPPPPPPPPQVPPLLPLLVAAAAGINNLPAGVIAITKNLKATVVRTG